MSADTPWARYNASHDVDDVLRHHGWTLISGRPPHERRYSRPGAERREVHASVDFGRGGGVQVFTPHDPILPAGFYSKFEVLARLEYNNDIAAAAAALRSQYGQNTPPPRATASVVYSAPPPRNPNPAGLRVEHDESGTRLFRVMVNRRVVDKGDYKRWVGFYTPALLTARELAEEVAAGHSVICAHLRPLFADELAERRAARRVPLPSRGPVYWRSGNCFAACDCVGIDIDTTALSSPGTLVTPFFRPDSLRYLAAAIIAYTTYSHTDARPRWRLIFGLSTPVSDYDSARVLIRRVAAAFDADPACTNPTSNLTGNSRIGRREPGHHCWLYTATADGLREEAL